MRGIELTVDGLAAGHDGVPAVEGVSFRLGEGGRLGILGRNGAGKTTALACIMGLAQRLAGSIALDGVAIAALPVHRRARAGLGYVPQTRDIFPSLSVEENLIAAAGSAPLRDRLDFAYDLFPRLRERRRNGGGQLSGGEQQMLAVARTLIGRPRLILLDEPLEGLAPRIRQELMAAIDRLVTTTGIGCILVEQHVDVVLDFATDVLILESGRPAFHGPVASLRQDSGILERTIGLRKAGAPDTAGTQTAGTDAVRH